MLTTSPSLLDCVQRANQPEAWDRFVRLYTPLLLLWARQQGFQDADAADLTQNVLIQLVRQLSSYERREGQTFRGWLFRVCENQCRDFRRRRATRAMPGPDGLSGIGEDCPVSEIDEVEYRNQLIRRGLEMVRGDFSDTTWAAFIGLAMEGREPTEVAAALGLQVNAVHQARYRIMSRLREELNGLLD